MLSLNDDLEDLFRKWGGSARFVFARMNKEELLCDFLHSCNLEDMIDILGV